MGVPELRRLIPVGSGFRVPSRAPEGTRTPFQAVTRHSWVLVKRGMDIALGLVLALAATPAMVFLALGSAIALREWPLFVHERVGRGAAPFRMVKIKTLPSEVPGYADKSELAAYRVPRFCLFLRRCHLDELPQLWLVVSGSMSLVGPRPHWDAPIEESYLRARTLVRPGCTGLWQIGHDRHLNCVQSPEYDLAYLENSSFLLDLWILWRTCLSIIGIGRPRSVDDVPAWVRRRAA